MDFWEIKIRLSEEGKIQHYRKRCMNIFVELLIALMYSRRAQLALWMGLISFFVILIVGHHLVGNLEFQGPFAPMSDAIKPLLLYRYEHIAWGSLISFWLLAVKILIKDRNKYLR
jgi:hypothetical protein